MELASASSLLVCPQPGHGRHNNPVFEEEVADSDLIKEGHKEYKCDQNSEDISKRYFWWSTMFR